MQALPSHAQTLLTQPQRRPSTSHLVVGKHPTSTATERSRDLPVRAPRACLFHPGDRDDAGKVPMIQIFHVTLPVKLHAAGRFPPGPPSWVRSPRGGTQGGTEVGNNLLGGGRVLLALDRMLRLSCGDGEYKCNPRPQNTPCPFCCQGDSDDPLGQYFGFAVILQGLFPVVLRNTRNRSFWRVLQFCGPARPWPS